LVYINVPQGVQDKYMTVLELQLTKPVKLYSGRGGFE
jgi:alpha-L-fucosidase